MLYRLRKNKSFQYRISIPMNYALSISLYFFFGIIGSFVYIDRKIQFAVLLTFAIFVILFSVQSDRDSRIGEYSYPLYIGHIFVVSTYLWAGTRFFSKYQNLSSLNSTMIQLLVMLFLSIGFAKLLLLLTQPIERIRDKTRTEQR